MLLAQSNLNILKEEKEKEKEKAALLSPKKKEPKSPKAEDPNPNPNTFKRRASISYEAFAEWWHRWQGQP